MINIGIVAFVIILFVVLMIGAVVGLITGSLLSVSSDYMEEDDFK